MTKWERYVATTDAGFELIVTAIASVVAFPIWLIGFLFARPTPPPRARERSE